MHNVTFDLSRFNETPSYRGLILVSDSSLPHPGHPPHPPQPFTVDSAAYERLCHAVAVLNPTALIFDCDGTLADSMPVHFVAWRETLEPLGVDFSEERFYALAGVPSDRILEMLGAEQGIDLDIDRLAVEKEERFLLHLPNLQPIPEVARLAQDRFGLCPIAVASGGFREIVHLQLKHLTIHELFPVVVTAEDTERHKPEPDVFLKAAELLAVEAGNCCVLEDSDLGIEAAKRAGMTWIDVRPWHPPRE